MFGMLDYRAHKLYLLIFFIPIFLLTLFSLFALPLIYYSIGFYFAEERVFQILISLISVFVFQIVLFLFICISFLIDNKLFLIDKLFLFIFELFVDVIPHDGRTKEEAQMVVYSGNKAIRFLAIAKHPTTWTDELINDVPKNDWVSNMFYRNNIVRRYNLIREYYQSRPEETLYFGHVEKVLEENDLVLKWDEKVFGSPAYRSDILTYSFLLFLLILNPLGYL